MISKLSTKIICFSSILIILHSFPMLSHSGDNKWTKVGQIRLKSLKGRLTGAAISPANPKIVYVVVDDSLVKKSTNRGEDWYWDWYQHWILINNGLHCRKINKLVFNPHKLSLLYACTDNGLYVLNEKNKKWSLIGPKDIAVHAIAFENQEPFDIKYVASAFKIFNFSNYNTGNLNTYFNTTDTIQAICISSENSKNNLYIGTNRGVCRISENDTTIKLTSERKSIGKRKVLDLSINKTSQFIFAATDSGGVYWAHSSDWGWRNLNDGLKHPLQSILSIAINQKDFNSLNIISSDGDAFEYNLNFPRIAFLEFNSSSLTPWERMKISNYFYSKFKNAYFISSSDKNEISPLKTESFASEKLISFGNAHGFEIIILGDIYTQGDKIYIRPRILYTHSSRDTTLDEIVSPKDSYYPTLLDDVIHIVNCEIKWRPNCFINKRFLNDSSKWLCRGFVAAIIYYVIKRFITKGQHNVIITPTILVDPIPIAIAQ